MSYIITISDWLPVSLNDLVRGWESARHRKHFDRQMIGIYARVANVPIAAGKRAVLIRLTQTVGRARDPDNCLKSVLDALVACGRLKDDSARWCMASVELRRGPRRLTEIILDDIEE